MFSVARSSSRPARRCLAAAYTSSAGRTRSSHVTKDANTKTRNSIIPRGQTGRPQPPTPYEMSLRIISVAEEGNLDRALKMLQSSALDSQSTSVWNTLLKHMVLAQRFKLAYDTFTEMKRRGFKPNSRTFHTLLSGFGSANEPLQNSDLLRAQKIHEQFQAYCEAQTPGSPNLELRPTNDYLHVLCNAGDWRAMLHIFWAMPTAGPLSPDQYTFTELFHALRARRVLHTGEADAPKGSQKDVDQRNAEDVSFLWKRLVQAASRGRVKIDSYVITPTLSALAKGSKECQEEGLAIVKEYLGLSDEIGAPMGTPRVQLSGHGLAAAQQLALFSKRFDLRLQYVQNIMFHKSAGIRSILGHQHLLRGLESLVKIDIKRSQRKVGAEAVKMIEWMLEQESQGGSGLGLRPNAEAYVQALLACRRTRDWDSAVRLVRLMSGYNLADFEIPVKDRPFGQPPSNSSIPLRFVVLPNVECMASLAHIARTNLEKRKPPYRHEDLLPLYSVLRFAHHLGAQQYFATIRKPLDPTSLERERWSDKTRDQRKLRSDIQALVKLVTPRGTTKRKGSASAPSNPSSQHGATPDLKDAGVEKENDKFKPSEWELSEWMEMASIAKDMMDKQELSLGPKTWQRRGNGKSWNRKAMSGVAKSTSNQAP